MFNVAILGFGTVGSGCAEVLSLNKEAIAKKCGTPVALKYILDIRSFPDSPFADLVTNNADQVFHDPELSCCIETIGGARIAYEYTKRALSNGISVVTSNKELVSTHGPELMQLAKENHCSYLYEASVGGGIPIIRPLYRCLAANRIDRIAGIVNGTTNYILTSMQNRSLSYEDALKEAQQNGYAEQNPSADVDGIDAQRKLSILSTIAMDGCYIAPSEIPATGISGITLEDLNFAREIGGSLKLIAYFERKAGRAVAYVAPHFVPKTNLLASVDDVFNAIAVTGNCVGDTLFYGRGAGMLPTASAVIGDVMELASAKEELSDRSWYIPEVSPVVPPCEVVSDFIVWGPGADPAAFETATTQGDGNIPCFLVSQITLGDLKSRIGENTRFAYYLS